MEAIWGNGPHTSVNVKTLALYWNTIMRVTVLRKTLRNLL